MTNFRQTWILIGALVAVGLVYGATRVRRLERAVEVNPALVASICGAALGSSVHIERAQLVSAWPPRVLLTGVEVFAKGGHDAAQSGDHRLAQLAAVDVAIDGEMLKQQRLVRFTSIRVHGGTLAAEAFVGFSDQELALRWRRLTENLRDVQVSGVTVLESVGAAGAAWPHLQVESLTAQRSELPDAQFIVAAHGALAWTLPNGKKIEGRWQGHGNLSSQDSPMKVAVQELTVTLPQNIVLKGQAHLERVSDAGSWHYQAALDLAQQPERQLELAELLTLGSDQRAPHAPSGFSRLSGRIEKASVQIQQGSDGHLEVDLDATFSELTAARLQPAVSLNHAHGEAHVRDLMGNGRVEWTFAGGEVGGVTLLTGTYLSMLPASFFGPFGIGRFTSNWRGPLQRVASLVASLDANAGLAVSPLVSIRGGEAQLMLQGQTLCLAECSIKTLNGRAALSQVQLEFGSPEKSQVPKVEDGNGIVEFWRDEARHWHFLSSALRFVTFERAQQLTLHGEASTDVYTVDATFKGSVPIAALTAWTVQTDLSTLATGEAPLAATLHLEGPLKAAPAYQLDVTSTLVGARLRIPLIASKSAQRPLALTFCLKRDFAGRSLLQGQLGSNLALNGAWRDREAPRLVVGNQLLPLPATPGILAFELPEAQGTLQFLPVRPQLGLDGAPASGAAKRGLVALSFQRLLWPTGSGEGGNVGDGRFLWPRLDPRRLPAIQFNCAECWIGEHFFGEVALSTTAIADGLRLESFDLNLGYLSHYDAEGAWTRNGTDEGCILKGEIMVRDGGEALKTLAISRSVSGFRGKIAYDASWPTIPLDAAAGLGQVRAQLDLADGAVLAGPSPVLDLTELVTLNLFGTGRKGAEFYQVKGGLRLGADGLHFEELYFDLPTAEMLLAGQANVEQRTIDTDVALELKPGRVAGAVTLAAIGPLSALDLVDLGPKNGRPVQIHHLMGLTYRIHGPWMAPVTEPVAANMSPRLSAAAAGRVAPSPGNVGASH